MATHSNRIPMSVTPTRLAVLLGERRIILSRPSCPEVAIALPNSRWFGLYAYLAYRRAFTGRGDAGYTSVDEIRQLPEWHGNTSLSIGKQIRRYLLARANAGEPVVIEARDSHTKGPYRITVSRSSIKFDRRREAVAVALGIPNWGDLVPTDLTARITAAAEFADAIAVGDVAFAAGRLAEADEALHAALAAARSVDERVLAWDRLARVARQHGREGDVARHLGAMRSALHAVERQDMLLSMRLLVDTAWDAFSRGDLNTAEETARHGLDVLLGGQRHYGFLGQLQNTLGNVMKARGRWDEATARFAEALSLWTLAGLPYFVQAALWNFGHVERLKGDALFMASLRAPGVSRSETSRAPIRPPESARMHYRAAENWMKRVMRYCVRTGVGDDTALDRLELARLAARQSRWHEAHTYNVEARARVVRAGNAHEVALADALGAAVIELRTAQRTRDAWLAFLRV